MLKILFRLFLLFSTCCMQHSLQAESNYASLYPETIQTIEGISFFGGDRHGEFEGDYVALLEDGSAWKIHPEDRDLFSFWEMGDVVRVKVRTSWYWFKREHKFELYNHNRGEAARVMLVKHKTNPLIIDATDSYAKSKGLRPVHTSVLKLQEDGSSKVETVTHYVYQEWDFRKILHLNDGSFWVIKENLDDFQLGNTVYVGAQGRPDTIYYDFVLIKGDQREAIWTWARTQY